MVRLTPPSAPSVPVFGSLPFIGLGKAAGLGPPPHIRMAQLAERYGDVMELKMGRAPWVVLSSPSAVHEAFVLKGDAFSGRPMVPSMSISSGVDSRASGPLLVTVVTVVTVFERRTLYSFELNVAPPAMKLRM